MRIANGLILAALAVTASPLALGHASFVVREFTEGSTAYLQMSLSHGCADESGFQQPTLHVSALLPNDIDLSGVAFSQDGSGTLYNGNAIMGVRVKGSEAWREIHRLTGEVPTYYSHGAKNEDVRAIHWMSGYVPGDMYDIVEFRGSFPLLQGCVSRLRVYIPAVQFCAAGEVNAWMPEPTPSFGAGVISAGYAPYVDVVRDSVANPLPANCAAGETVSVLPHEDDIETFLTMGGTAATGGGGSGDGGGHENH